MCHLRTILNMLISLLNNAKCWEMLKKEMLKTCQGDINMSDVEQRDDKNLLRTRAVLDCLLPQLVPSKRPLIPLWIAHLCLGFASSENFVRRPSSAEVGSTQSQAVYCLFVNSSKRICAMFIKYFHSFLLEFLLCNICCVSKLISHLQKSHTHVLLLIVFWVVLIAEQPDMLGICVGNIIILIFIHI